MAWLITVIEDFTKTRSSLLQFLKIFDSHSNRIMENEVDDQDHLAHYDNNDEVYEYESEEYSDDEADGNNTLNQNVVKRGITRLYKFRKNYGKPGGIKLSVTFDAMYMITGPNRALFSSFLGDLVREHIGLKILSWKKVDSEARDKLWDEITRYFDVGETVRKLVMLRLGGLLRNFRRKLRQNYILPNQNTPSKLNEVPAKYSAIVNKSEWVAFVNYMTTEEYQGKSAATKIARSKSVYQHTMGRGGYVYVKEKMIKDKEIEADQEPPRALMWVKGRINKAGEFPNEAIKSVGKKLKETDDKINEGTLKAEQGTDAITVVFKEKGGYARGVGSGVTYKRYFDLPRNRQASDERVALIQSELDNERRERKEKEVVIKNLSDEMAQTKGMVTQLMSQLAAQGEQLQSLSTQLPASNVSPVEINPKQCSTDQEGGSPLSVVGCEKDASIQNSTRLVTSENEMESMELHNSVGSYKTPESQQNAYPRPESRSNENVSPPLLLPQEFKCRLWHLKKSSIIALGTVYQSDGKQMLHSKKTPK